MPSAIDCSMARSNTFWKQGWYGRTSMLGGTIRCLVSHGDWQWSGRSRTAMRPPDNPPQHWTAIGIISMQELHYSSEHKKCFNRFAISALLLALTTPLLHRGIRSVASIPD